MTSNDDPWLPVPARPSDTADRPFDRDSLARERAILEAMSGLECTFLGITDPTERRAHHERMRIAHEEAVLRILDRDGANDPP